MIILNGRSQVVGCSSDEKEAFCVECPSKKSNHCLLRGVKVKPWKGMNLNKEGITRVETWRTK